MESHSVHFFIFTCFGWFGMRRADKSHTKEIHHTDTREGEWVLERKEDTLLSALIRFERNERFIIPKELTRLC